MSGDALTPVRYLFEELNSGQDYEPADDALAHTLAEPPEGYRLHSVICKSGAYFYGYRVIWERIL